MRQSTVILFPKRLSRVMTVLFIIVLVGFIAVLASDAAATHTTCPVSLFQLKEVAALHGTGSSRDVQQFYVDLCGLYELREDLAATQPNEAGAAIFLAELVKLDVEGRNLGLLTTGDHARIPTLEQSTMMLEYLNTALNFEPITLEVERTTCGVDSPDEILGTECWDMISETPEQTVGVDFQDGVGVVQVSTLDYTFSRVCHNVSLDTIQGLWECSVDFLSFHPGGAEWYCNTYANWTGPGYLGFWRPTDGDMCQPFEWPEPKGKSDGSSGQPAN